MDPYLLTNVLYYLDLPDLHPTLLICKRLERYLSEQLCRTICLRYIHYCVYSSWKIQLYELLRSKTYSVYRKKLIWKPRWKYKLESELRKIRIDVNSPSDLTSLFLIDQRLILTTTQIQGYCTYITFNRYLELKTQNKIINTFPIEKSHLGILTTDNRIWYTKIVYINKQIYPPFRKQIKQIKAEQPIPNKENFRIVLDFEENPWTTYN